MNQTTPRVMMLIDADNVTADVIEQALPLVMQRHGAIHVRRAYCTAELALKHLKLFKAHSIRPIVNVSTGKNSTDIALAVDAMDLVVAERPDLVVIVSSDSDFAPLVIRLREKGCRVEGIGQEGKTGEDSKPVYDAFLDIPHRKGKAAVTRAAPAKRATRGTARQAPAEIVPAPEPELVFPPVEPPEVRAPARKRAARAPRSAVLAATPAAAAVPVPVSAPAVSAASQVAAPLPTELKAAPAPRKRAGRSTKAVAAETAALLPAVTPVPPPVAAPAPALAPARSPAPTRRERQPRAQSPSQPQPRQQPPSPPPQPQAAQSPRQQPRQRAQAPRAAAAPSLPDEVARILAALPELQSGARLQLNLAKERLCNAGLLAKSAPSTKLFRKHPRLFALTPEAAPNKVQFLRPTPQ